MQTSPNCTVIELPVLGEDECRAMLSGVVKERRGSMLAHKITAASLAHKVHATSEGNPYWCAVMVGFIRDYGVHEFERACSLSSAGRASVMDSFVMARLKGMTSDAQLILKWAAVFGKEFTLEDLCGVVPPSFGHSVSSAMDSFVYHSFVSAATADEDAALGTPAHAYCFVNSSVQQAIYHSITPAAAAKYHYTIADYLERKFVEDAAHAADFAALSLHYTQCLVKFPEKRLTAFNYTLKAASNALGNRAYRDGLHHCYEAVRIARHDAERALIRELADGALEQLRAAKARMSLVLRERRRSQATVAALDTMRRESINGANWEHNEELLQDFESFKAKLFEDEVEEPAPEGMIRFVDSIKFDELEVDGEVDGEDEGHGEGVEEEGGGEQTGEATEVDAGAERVRPSLRSLAASLVAGVRSVGGLRRVGGKQTAGGDEGDAPGERSSAGPKNNCKQS